MSAKTWFIALKRKRLSIIAIPILRVFIPKNRNSAGNGLESGFVVGVMFLATVVRDCMWAPLRGIVFCHPFAFRNPVNAIAED